MSPQPPGPQCHPEAEGRQTADRIVERAAELFAQKGFAGTSIREIAEAAGVTKPTLYYHFGSKKGLVRHIIVDVMGDFARILTDDVGSPRTLREILLTLAQAHLDFARARPATVALICRLNHQPPGEEWAPDLRRLEEEGLLVMRAHFAAAAERGDIARRDPELLALSFLGSLVSHTVYRLRQPGGLGLVGDKSVAANIVDLFLEGAHRGVPLAEEAS
jgi:AcrR family transcriptional regulator